MTLIIIGYHWQQHFWNIWKIAYIPIIFQALCGPWILDRSTALREQFRKFSVEARYSKRNPGPPSLSQRDVEAPGAGGKCFQPQQVSFGCETW